RKLYPEAFTAGNFALSIDESHWDNGRKIKLTHNDLNMFVAGNFRATNTTTTADFPSTGTWYELLTDQELNVTSTNMQLSLAAGEVRVYTDRKINIPNSISTTASDDALFIYHAGGLVSVVSPDSHNITALSLYSLQGSLLKTAFNTSAINVSDVPGGLYLLEIRIGDKQVVKKVVIR
ncbi:MAG: T9SS type A sorting domain-containing protein, partial [Bacteroidales bacterium]|nr:T9SS type A sorting domain-containing protein [Bacteroidales bacterium]